MTSGGIGCREERRRKFPSSFWDVGLAKHNFEIGSVCLWHPATSFTLLYLTALHLSHQEPALCFVHQAMILYPDLPFLSAKCFILSIHLPHLPLPRHPCASSILRIATASKVKRKAILLFTHING